MIVDIENGIKEYPYTGTFSTSKVIEGASLVEEQTVDVVVLHTECDIQQATKADTFGVVRANFNVYFPYDIKEGISITNGMKFQGNANGLEVNGIVVGVYPNQLGGCVCSIRDLDV